MYTYKVTSKTNCKFCGNLFKSSGSSKVCPDCNANMDTYFKNIRAYLGKFPGATPAEIHEALELPEAIISYYFKVEKPRAVLRKCEICGRPIASGTRCFSCKLTATGTEAQSARQINGADAKF